MTPTSLSHHRERVVQLGTEGNIVAIATDPDPHPAEASRGVVARPTVIFLNAGVLHRVGPHRLHVSLARMLADSGLPSLRLDLSGIGDSRNVPGGLSFRESSVADIRATVDQLQAEGRGDRFILFGLCSGADNALAAADADVRVAGLILIDPPTYATARARLRLLRQCLQSTLPPVKKLRRSLAIVTAPARHAARAVVRFLVSPGRKPPPPIVEGRQAPPKAELGALMSRLVKRGVPMLCVYSGSMCERYNGRDQVFEVFPQLRGRIDVAYFPAANHVFTELVERRELIATVRR